MSISVFPACAGMFRPGRCGTQGQQGFPRVRGDVPPIFEPLPLPPQFSPRARGCSLFFLVCVERVIVFPACAGMFLDLMERKMAILGFPRVRGDVPISHFEQ